MAKSKTLSDRGKFKNEINLALYKNADICELLLGDTSNMSNAEKMKEFKKYVQPHLFIDDTIIETKTFIFYDVIFPSLSTQTKECQVVMFLICSRDILDNYVKEGYFGDRIDALSQMVENALVNDEDTANKFGIGKLSIDSVGIYNSVKMYGCELRFSVPTYR